MRDLYDALLALPDDDLPRVHLVGGAELAAELDAERAIEQGTRVAAGLGEGARTPGAATAVGTPA